MAGWVLGPGEWWSSALDAYGITSVLVPAYQQSSVDHLARTSMAETIEVTTRIFAVDCVMSEFYGDLDPINAPKLTRLISLSTREQMTEWIDGQIKRSVSEGR